MDGNLERTYRVPEVHISSYGMYPVKIKPEDKKQNVKDR